MVKKLPWMPKYKVSNQKAKILKMLKVVELTKAGKSQQDIMDAIGVKDRTQVFRYQTLATETIDPKTGHPYLERDETTKTLKVPKIAKTKEKWNVIEKEIAKINIPEIKKFWDVITKKNKGKGLVHAENILTRALTVLNTVDVHPKHLLDGSFGYEDELAKNPLAEPDHLLSLEKCMLIFSEKFKNGQAVYAHTAMNTRTVIDQADKEIIHYVLPMRALYSANGKPVPRGYGGKGHILSGAKINFGVYSEVQLTDKQKSFGIKFLLEKFGLREAAFFALQYEMFTRSESMDLWTASFIPKTIPIDGIICEYLEARVYESKTDKTWTKTIIDPDVIAIAKQLPVGKRIFDGIISYKSLTQMNIAMRALFVELGLLPKEVLLSRKDPNYPKFRKTTQEFYLTNRALYTNRHSGAHQAMRRANYNATIVASDGWDTIDILTMAYAKLPSEYKFQQGVCYYCNPPSNIETDNFYFCGYRHAIIFLQNGHKTKEQMGKFRSAGERLSTVLDEISQKEKKSIETIAEPFVSTSIPHNAIVADNLHIKIETNNMLNNLEDLVTPKGDRG